MSRRSQRILYAEDDENDVFLMRRAMERAGVSPELVHVADGQLAIDYLRGEPPYADRERFPLPDLMLLDLKMPRMGGFDVLAWIRTRPELKLLPVVVLSSSNQEADVRRALGMGARDYLVKPHDSGELVGLCRQLVERWLKEVSADPGS